MQAPCGAEEYPRYCIEAYCIDCVTPFFNIAATLGLPLSRKSTCVNGFNFHDFDLHDLRLSANTFGSLKSMNFGVISDSACTFVPVFQEQIQMLEPKNDQKAVICDLIK
jgi:hypothetical protein